MKSNKMQNEFLPIFSDPKFSIKKNSFTNKQTNYELIRSFEKKYKKLFQIRQLHTTKRKIEILTILLWLTEFWSSIN